MRTRPSVQALRVFHPLGIRMISLTWMRRTAFGDGTWENESGGGLTRLGRAAVRAMNEIGIIVDVSHASDRTVADILDVSEKPVVASHSNARALCDHLRNLTDEMIRRIAEGGGVIGISSLPYFVDAESPSIARWVDHLQHICAIGGIDHVAIGADFTARLAELQAFPGSRAYRSLDGLAGPEASRP